MHKVRNAREAEATYTVQKPMGSSACFELMQCISPTTACTHVGPSGVGHAREATACTHRGRHAWELRQHLQLQACMQGHASSLQGGSEATCNVHSVGSKPCHIIRGDAGTCGRAGGTRRWGDWIHFTELAHLHDSCVEDSM